LRRTPDLSLGFETLAFSSMPALRPSRRALRTLKAACVGSALVVLGTTQLQTAIANGDTRTITMHHTHSGEDGTFTFKKDGRYDAAVLEKLNWFLRDWRTQEPIKMDPQLFDIVWEVYRENNGNAPIQIVSAYRSPKTNAMLRSRSRGVAQFSQHTLGKAMDFYVPGVDLAGLRAAGLRLQRGGVGFYPTSGSPFVHMDTGSIRHWPRMTPDQLARVFPDGKTVHVPTNGKPLANYAAAMAEVQARGARGGTAMASAGTSKNIFAGLFGKKTADEEEGSESAAPVAAPARTPELRATRAPVLAQASLTAAPLPPSRPATLSAGPLVMAEASAPLPLRRPAEIARANAASVPLPAVITRGTSLQSEPTALGYAAAGNPADASGMAGLLSPVPTGHGPAPLAATTSARPREAQPSARRVTQIAFGRLFLSPSLSSDLYLRTPELRVFAGFMAAPREVVALGFAREAPAYAARFTGTAVAELPTYVYHAPAMALNRRM